MSDQKFEEVESPVFNVRTIVLQGVVAIQASLLKSKFTHEMDISDVDIGHGESVLCPNKGSAGRFVKLLIKC